MNTITWSEIAVRLLFAFIIGSGVAIETKWYRTRKLLESNAQMATGAAMFAILIQITSNTIGASELILGVSIVCAGILIQKQIEPQNINTVIKLWCAGAAGTLVGYGLFVPAYLGTLIIVLASWVCLSPGLNQKIEQARGKRKVIHSTYRNHRQFVIKN